MKIINVEIVNPFLESMANVLTTMAMLEPSPGKVMLKEKDIACGEITGIIGLIGDNYKASLAVTFERAVILEITARMLGEPVTEIDDTVIDMVGELTNMVTGGAKNLLSQKPALDDLLVNEFKILMESRHPNIIRMYDIF